MFHTHPRRRRGVTLVEIMIALAVVSTISLFFMSSIIFTIQQTRANRDHINALQIIDYHMGLLKVAQFAELGEPPTSIPTWETQNFNFRDATPKPVKGDPNDPDSTTYNISFEFSGWGVVQSATDTTVTVTIPSNHRAWTANQWVDNYVSVIPPVGRAQIARIVGNNSNTLTITTDLSGLVNDQEWERLPAAGDIVRINDGKTVTITVRWGDGQDHRTIQRTFLKGVGR